MRSLKFLFIVSVLGFLFTTTSCKKEEQVSCTLKTIAQTGTTLYLEFDANGFETKRTDSAMADYRTSTVSGNILTQQTYTMAGVPTGTPYISVLNSNGTVAQSIDFDTLFFTYNSDGYLVHYTRGSGSNFSNSYDYTIENGNVVYIIERNSVGNITRSTILNYNTDKPNKANINLAYSFLSDGRYGKASTNLIKQIQNSNGTTITVSNITYQFEENGYPVVLNILSQPGNTNNLLYLGYSCN